jgi:hypothetical protein
LWCDPAGGASIMVKSGLLIEHKWCSKILHDGKRWEIRNRNCRKRENVALISTSKSSPGGKNLQVGTATIVDCIVVARQHENGNLSAPPEAPHNFMFLEEHLSKHQIYDLADFPCLAQYKTVYAWVLSDVVESTDPKPKQIHVKKGCIVWVNL